jgi:RNA polymerase sigma-70 factor (ECF subfamily)
MPGEPTADHLSGISTMWTVLRLAHAGTDAAGEAKRVLVERYGGAVRRYLLGLLKDPHVADDLSQDFAVRLLGGGFRHADPARGRFRNYVKTALFHLVSEHARKGRKTPHPVAPDDGVLAALAAESDQEGGAFADSWRAELLARAWEALRAAHPPQYAALRFRADHPSVPSEEVARRLGGGLTAAGVRQQLKRGRALFAALLVEQVTHSLENPTPDAVDAELADLNLLALVKPAEA